MTSLLDGSSIMHLASQLVQQQQKNGQDSASPSYTNAQQLTLEMFKNSGLFSCLQNQSVGMIEETQTSSQNSDTASSESPEPPIIMQHHENEEQQLALMRSLGQTIDMVSSGDENSTEATMRDLMPVLAAANQVCTNAEQQSQSAWARNAGRKKSHPVWEFFRDLKDSTGAGGVICLHCSWCGDDRSPNNLRTHLKKFHTDDGIFTRFSQKLASTPTQPYVKRVRGANGGHNHHSSNNSMSDQKPSMIDSMAFALQQLQQSGSLGDFNTSFNFLDSLPKSSEIINISGGFNGPTSTNSQQNDNDEDDNENHAEAASSSSASADNEPHTRNTDTPDAATPQTPTSSNGGTSFENGSDLAALVSNLASTNPMMLAMLNAANGTGSGSADNHTSTDKSSAESPDLEKDPSSFSLSDGPCAAVLMSMALDLDMTMSYHRRRVDIELCFESNRTAEKSGGRGKVICLTDMGKEIKIVERVNGAVSGTELWTKTDFNQFHWAIRGKCQKCFNKP